ncbi:MAG TPA: fumarylacetoacetate hydrolase family protein [Steroidobacteraceae bacterium]|jgi:2-keto-4-pentenoate hydratase/2-oxohepta-3-ene-1,7-dioic acid hydratase in catechol pathway|nr:fumarylacetoacetate hydrolase family protein [Steroidobacteraceae bacterium]
MKLLRYGSPQHEKPGLLDDAGAIRDLSAHIDDISPQTVTPRSLARLAALNSAELPVVGGAPRLGVPVNGIGKFIAIGLNYADHAKEANLPIPAEPPLFTKAISCLNGPNDAVMLPKDSRKGDWEVELGVIFGRTARYVSEDEALDCVAGYVLANDVSERAFQMERGTQWDKGKGCDTFGPVGPWLVTADEVGDPQKLEMFLDHNGRRMQTGHTGRMIFSVRRLIAYVSQFMTMYPGDLMITGTPPGVGMGRKPDPIFLKPGDEMHLGIEKLGEQRQRVIPWHHLGEDDAER